MFPAKYNSVALPTEGVDRNYDTHTLLMAVQVALSNQTPGRHFSSICRGLHDPFSLHCPGRLREGGVTR